MSNVESELDRKIADAKVEGWKVDRQEGDRVILTRHDWAVLEATSSWLS